LMRALVTDRVYQLLLKRRKAQEAATEAAAVANAVGVSGEV
jgi:hypothetical protein